MIDVKLGSVAALLEAIPQLIWTADTAGNVIFVNHYWTQFTGLQYDELLGWGWTRTLEPAQRADVVDGWKSDAARGAAISEHRVQYRRIDGTYVWFLWRAVPIFDAAGALTGWVGTQTDIDALVRFEQELTANEERVRSILENTLEGVCIVDTAANIRYVNRRFAQLLNYEPHELFGKSVFELFPEAERQQTAEQFARREAGEGGMRECCFRRRDGRDVWTITAGNPIFDKDGAFAGSVGFITDITERKALEVQLSQRVVEYESLAETIPHIVWTAQPDGAVDYVNNRWTEYTGMIPGDARNWGWLPAVHRDDVSALLVAWRTAVNAGTDFEAALRLRRYTDATYRWHVMRARAVRAADGTITRWFGTLTDIHNERRTARQLEIISRTSTVLAESFDRDALLKRLADLICDEFAQFVCIGLINEERRLYIAGSAHRDPANCAALNQLHGRRLLLRAYESAAVAQITNGGTYAGRCSAQELSEFLLPDVRGALLSTGAGAFVCAPLQARGRGMGAIVAFAPPDTPFSDDDAAILTEIAARAAVAVENADLYAREHRVSATLQQALLPARLPDIPGIDFDAIYQPGATEAQIGGDWYDAVELPDGRVLVSIGDVTGRGLRAAVIMGRVRQAIEALATYQSDPAQLLNAADVVLRRAHPDAIVTALVGVIDLNRRTFAYATAGHPTPIVRAGDGRIVTLPGSGLPLGLRDAQQPPTSTIVLPSSALLLLFTDGLVESTRNIDEGERRVLAALRTDAVVNSAHPAAALRTAVLHDGCNDDVAVFTIRIGDLDALNRLQRTDSPLRSAWSMHWSFDARDARSTRNVRDLFIAYLRAKGRPDADYHGAEVVFGELLGNVARHAPGTVDIEVEWRGDAPVLHVLDRGPGYDRAESLPPQLSESGRGLYLVSTLTREFTVTRLPGYGSHARAVLALDRS